MNREILSGPVKLLVLNDRSDTWGHGVKSYHEVAGQFEPEGETCAAKGGLFSAIYANLKYAGGGKTKVGRKETFAESPSLSRAFIETRVYEELPWIEMRIFVNWNKPRSILKLEIPFKMGSPESIIARVPGGKSTRPSDGAENPLQSWIRLKGLFSAAMCQKGAYAYDCNKNRLRITLVRSSYYGYDQGTPLNFQPPQRNTDLGMHEFEFRIYVGKDADGEIVDRAGFEMHEPFWVIQEAGKYRR
jgi:alpha-mannosidase